MSDTKAKQEPIYWFVRLELATARRDQGAIAQAKAELQRLGVQVNYLRRRKAVQK
jgi:hypothetical protein